MTHEEAICKHGNRHYDGLLVKLQQDGFRCVGQHLGGAGWIIGADGPPYADMPDRHWICPPHLLGRVIFVDHWGGGWALPLETPKET